VVFGRAEGPYAKAIALIGCQVVDLRMRSWTDLSRALRATAQLREFPVHHFHVVEPCQMMTSALSDDAVRVFTQRHGAHETPESVRKRARRSIAGCLMRERFHAVSGNTQHATRYAIERYGLEHLPHLVTYNGIDFSLLETKRTRVDSRREIGADQAVTVVGSCGKLIDLKRFDRLINLLAAVKDAHVLLVGDGHLRASLEAHALALGVHDRLHITGAVEDVADYLSAMDIFVLPSGAEESFGNAVVEAMAMGVPSVVFSDSPGPCEHIENGVTGFVVGDEHELVSIVRILSKDPGHAGQIGREGARHVRSKYSLERMHDSYRDLYELAIANHISSAQR
jgi:glycosyltransferase involved in cell wall biosynthesis